MNMKRIVLGLGVVLALASCSTGAVGTVSTITKVAKISTAISEITGLLGGLNLSQDQTSLVANALKAYITNYNGLDTTKEDYKSLLEGYKTQTLNDIKTGIGESKYGQFISALKTSADKANNTTVSDATRGVIASLIK